MGKDVKDFTTQKSEEPELLLFDDRQWRIYSHNGKNSFWGLRQ
jgi:hypothetical protein